MKKVLDSKIPVIIGSLIFLFLSYVPLFLRKDVLEAFVNEDQIFENLTVVYFLVISVFFIIYFIRFRPIGDDKKYSLLKKIIVIGFALLFFVGAGEEISWGQRIFNIQTPQALEDANVQKELTIHNLEIFQGDKAALDFSSLQTVFSLAFAFVFPVAGYILKRLNFNLVAIFPVMPLYLSVLVVVNYIIQKSLRYVVLAIPAIYQHPTMPFTEGLYEIREHGNSYAMMISVIFYVAMRIVFQRENSSALNK